MTDVLSAFADMLEQSSAVGEGSIELLVVQLGEEGELLRRCAITHQFTPELLRVLDPSLDESAARDRFYRLARLSMVMSSPDGLALHDRAREQLFAGWLAAERIAELREISRRLVVHFDALINFAVGAEREKLLRRRLFHLVAVNQDAGIDAFEESFETSRGRNRYTACDNAVRMVREYESILAPANRARVAYREAKLALSRGNVELALELFITVAAEPAVDVAHRAKALNGIGLAHTELCHWKRAALAFLEALRFAEEHEETLPYRSGFMINLAAVYRDSGNIEPSEALLKRSAAMAETSNYKHLAASVHNTFGTLYLRAGEPEKAIVSLRESLARLGEDDFARARVYNNLGLASMRVPDLQAAEEWFNRSLEMKSVAGDTVGQANTHINLVRLYREQQSPHKAVAAAAMAADLFARVFFWKEAGDANAMLARFYVDAHKPTEAARALFAAFDAYDRARAPEERERLRAQMLRPMQETSFITNVVSSASSDSESQIAMLAEQLEIQDDPRYVHGKRPALAVTLSLLIVGLGQLYNGDVKKGLLMIAISITSAIIRASFEEMEPFSVLVSIILLIWSPTDAWRVASGRWRRW